MVEMSMNKTSVGCAVETVYQLLLPGSVRQTDR